MVDSHCHLNDSQFEGQIESEINRAKSVGVTTLVCNGYDLPSSEKALRIAETYEEVFATVGCHPESKDFDKKLFLKLSQHQKVVAIGECGLDYTPETTEEEKTEQRELLKFNLELARETKMPLVVHCRNAFDDIFEMIDYDRVQMHCFTGNMAQMQECVRRGWYMSFGGVVTFKSSNELREVVTQVPADRLLLETDSPYISPEPVRGKPNFPANLIYIARLIAQTRNIALEEVDKLTTANAYRLLSKLKLPSR